MDKKARYRETLLGYLSNPELPFPIRSQYGDIIGRTRKTVYDHFTPGELSEIEREAYQNRKSSCVRQRSNVLTALYESAIGYHHAETHVSNHNGKVILTPLIKRYPPDKGAAKEFFDRIEGKVVEKQEIDFVTKDRKFNLSFNNFHVDTEKNDKE